MTLAGVKESSAERFAQLFGEGRGNGRAYETSPSNADVLVLRTLHTELTVRYHHPGETVMDTQVDERGALSFHHPDLRTEPLEWAALDHYRALLKDAAGWEAGRNFESPRALVKDGELDRLRAFIEAHRPGA